MSGITDLSEQLPRLIQDMADKGMDREIGRLLETLLLGEDGKPAAGLEETVNPPMPGETSFSLLASCGLKDSSCFTYSCSCF